MAKNPDQGTMFLPGVANRETVANGETQFTRYAGLAVVQPLAGPEPETDTALSADVVARKALVRRALGSLGATIETAPATRVDEDPAARAALKRKFGADYDEKVAKMAEDNKKHQAIFNDRFNEMWGLEDVKKSGLMSDEEEINRKLQEDKRHFVAKFSESPRVTAHRAKLNRENYRYKLDRTEKIYKRNNLGIWPAKPAKKQRRKAA